MADFALWATACEAALWEEGKFWSAYCGNRDEPVESVIEADSIAFAVRAMLKTLAEWKGTATELLGEVGKVVSEAETKSKTWPKSARGLSGRLRRAATFLRKTGIEIHFQRETEGIRTRIITITNTRNTSQIQVAQPSRSSGQSVMTDKAYSANGIIPFTLRTVEHNSDDGKEEGYLTVRTNLLKSRTDSVSDDTDANKTPQSGAEKTGTTGWKRRL